MRLVEAQNGERGVDHASRDIGYCSRASHEHLQFWYRLAFYISVPVIVAVALWAMGGLNITSGNVTKKTIWEEIKRHEQSGAHPAAATSDHMDEIREAMRATKDSLIGTREEVARIGGRQQVILDAVMTLQEELRRNGDIGDASR